MCFTNPGQLPQILDFLECEENICPAFSDDKSRAEKRNRRGLAGLQNFIPESPWLSVFYVENCQNIDLSRMQSRLVPHCHLFRDRVLQLAVLGLPLFQRQTRQCAASSHTRRDLFPCVLGRVLFLQPYSHPAPRLNSGCHPLGTFSTAAFAASLAGRSHRR